MVHKFRLFDMNIVLDVNSGSVHVFDDIAYELLDFYKSCDFSIIMDKLGGKYTADELKEALYEIQSLEKAGLLFTDDPFENCLQPWSEKPGIKALCINISHDCNMRCAYCFASTGDFGKGRKLMSLKTAKKSIDFLISKSGNRKNLEVDFFGGEPLLNFGVVKETVEYAKARQKECSKNFRFTLTTNALLLNEEHKRFINENIGNIVMSIDGRKNINDCMRKGAGGSGTYDRIFPKIKDMADSRKHENYYVRGTFTRQNLDFSKDVLHLADEGMKHISLEPVVADRGTGYEIREEDLPLVYKEYEKLALEYVKRRETGREFSFFHFLIDLNQGPCLAKRITGCGAGYEYVAVTPEGDIYPCHQFIGMNRFKMGNVNDGGIDNKIQELFYGSNVYTNEECKQCWAKFYCSGGCVANAFKFNGDMHKPYKIGCEMEKKRLECAIWINARMHGSME